MHAKGFFALHIAHADMLEHSIQQWIGSIVEHKEIGIGGIGIPIECHVQL